MIGGEKWYDNLLCGKSGMGVHPLVLFLALYSVLVFPVDAFTEPADVTALHTILDNWKDILSANWSGADPCSSYWIGVYCTNGTVTKLDLAGRGLAGPLPAAIGDLANLTALVLSQNNLNGTIPPQIGNLTLITTLELTRNGFTGRIPSSINQLSNHRQLSLDQNFLVGPLPNLSNLTLLARLNLNANFLSGPLPDLSGLRNIQFLRLQDNQFTGSIPSEIGNLPSLQNLGMENNHLIGSLPDTINQLSSIPYLFLQNNRLNGPLPDLSGLFNLEGLDLTNNSFVLGSVPTWLSKMQGLINLNLVNCGLTGAFPSWLTHNLQSMTTAKFDLNQFNGTLDISNVNTNLTLLSLEDNNISGLYGTVPGFIRVALAGNPICKSLTFLQPDLCDRLSGYGPRTWQHNVLCTKLACQQGQSRTPQNCSCSYPLISRILLISPSFNTFNAPRIGGLGYQLAGQLRVTSDRVWIQSANLTFSNQTLVDVLVFPAQSGLWNGSELSFIEMQLRSGKSLSGYGKYLLLNLALPQGNVIKQHSKTLRLVLEVTLPVVTLLIATLFAIFLWRRYMNKEFMLRYGVHQGI